MNNIKEHQDVILNENEYGDINIKGNMTVSNDIYSENIKLKGNLDSSYSIKCKETINIKGSVVCHTIEAKEFSLHGKIQAHLIKSNELKIVSNNECRINKIEADKIVISNVSNAEMNKRIMDKLLEKIGLDDVEYSQSDNLPSVTILEINGKDVFLENINADIVRCVNANLEGKCSIKELIYSGDASISKNSTVTNRRRE